MNEEGNTAFSRQVDNLNLAAWLIANGVPLQHRKTITVTHLDSTTHDTQRGTWTFAEYDITGRSTTADLIAAFRMPSGDTVEPAQVYALACHNWLCLKTCITQGAPLFYDFITPDKQLIRLSNRQGQPLQRGTLAAGTSSLILAAVSITLGVIPLGYSFSGTRFFIQLPGNNDMVNKTRWILQHMEETRPDDMSLHTLICTAFYNREELKKDVYTPKETLAVKVGTMTAYIDKNAPQDLTDRVAETLSI